MACCSLLWWILMWVSLDFSEIEVLFERRKKNETVVINGASSVLSRGLSMALSRSWYIYLRWNHLFSSQFSLYASALTSLLSHFYSRFRSSSCTYIISLMAYAFYLEGEQFWNRCFFPFLDFNFYIMKIILKNSVKSIFVQPSDFLNSYWLVNPVFFKKKPQVIGQVLSHMYGAWYSGLRVSSLQVEQLSLDFLQFE